MITFKHQGQFTNTEKFLNRLKGEAYMNALSRYGQEGVKALEAATPVDSGLTATSWTYEITRLGGTTTLSWSNSNVQNGVNIAVILQHGHGTGTGGFVQGRDYINPAVRPVFDKIARELWKEVTSL